MRHCHIICGYCCKVYAYYIVIACGAGCRKGGAMTILISAGKASDKNGGMRL
jgi:hypothetical protein